MDNAEGQSVGSPGAGTVSFRAVLCKDSNLALQDKKEPGSKANYIERQDFPWTI